VTLSPVDVNSIFVSQYFIPDHIKYAFVALLDRAAPLKTVAHLMAFIYPFYYNTLFMEILALLRFDE